jgi:hypothetical protein
VGDGDRVLIGRGQCGVGAATTSHSSPRQVIATEVAVPRGPGTRRGWCGVDAIAAFLCSLRRATTTEVLMSWGPGGDGTTTARSRGMARGGSEGGEVNERKRGVGRRGLRHSVSLRGTWCKAEEERSASKDGRGAHVDRWSTNEDGRDAGRSMEGVG